MSCQSSSLPEVLYALLQGREICKTCAFLLGWEVILLLLKAPTLVLACWAWIPTYSRVQQHSFCVDLFTGHQVRGLGAPTAVVRHLLCRVMSSSRIAVIVPVVVGFYWDELQVSSLALDWTVQRDELLARAPSEQTWKGSGLHWWVPSSSEWDSQVGCTAVVYLTSLEQCHSASAEELNQDVYPTIPYLSWN